jgi:hypothetical protein
VASDERFFAAPYEPIYYFLTDQPTPTPSTMIMDFMSISDEQETQILADLNPSKVRWIVTSCPGMRPVRHPAVCRAKLPPQGGGPPRR